MPWVDSTAAMTTETGGNIEDGLSALSLAAAPDELDHETRVKEAEEFVRLVLRSARTK